MKKKRIREKFLGLKLLVAIIYLIIITILFVCSYRLLQAKNNIKPFEEAESVDDYTYIDIYKMSEKFAYYKDTNLGIHFVIEKEDTGLWHTYLVAIDEDYYNKYKEIIDYTYERIDKEPEPIRVYGYPVIVDDKIKELAIKDIASFVPEDNEVVITDDNYDNYLTNSYLDTTKPEKDKFSIALCITLMLLLTVIVLFVSTMFLKDKPVRRKSIKERDHGV
ncbi:MAG: hypothetical protein IKE63_02940 [Bacilli bacterium]|nr:hypothetical protein [Bacilli bacterium]